MRGVVARIPGTSVRVFLLCCALALPLFQGAAASAQSDSDRGASLLLEIASYGDDIEGAGAFYASLSEDDQALLQWGWSHLETVSESPAAPDVSAGLAMTTMSTGCTSGWATQGFTSFGVEQFRFSSGTYWCWSGASITYVESLGTRPDATFLGWQYQGVYGGGVENWGTTAYKLSQTYYRLCYAYCIQDAYPWIASYGEADYAFWWNYGGV